MTIREEKEMQGIHSGKEEEKMSLFADDVILYIENLKCASRKLLELIDEFGKVARYKINTQKSFALLYTNSKRSEGEIKETIPFTITSKRIKYLGINLPKEAKDLYSENYKMLKSVKVNVLAQSCPTLCDAMDCSLPGSSELGILQARILEWVAMPFSRGSS